MIRRGTLVATTVSVAVAACGGGDVSDDAVTVTDSAGVTVTMSADHGATYATVNPEAIVSLGGPNARGSEQFYRIDNVLQDARDRLWVADVQSGELRVSDASGTPVLTRGGRGEGPGEFLLIRLLGAFAGDSVAVADQRTGRLSVYDADGTVARTVQVPSGQRALPRPFDVYPDGSMLGQVPEVRLSDATAPGEILAGDVRLVRFDLDRGTSADVAAGEGPIWLWTGREQVPIPFTANAGFALRGEELHLVAGTTFRVRVFEGGRVTRIYAVERDEQEVRQADIDAYRELVRDAYPEEQHASHLDVLDHPVKPTTLPAYRSLVVAADGTVWVGRYSPDTEWDVFDVDGRFLGLVQMPDNFRLTSVRGDRLAGVWQDELGVEYVRVYEMQR